MKKTSAIAALLLLAACSDADDARKTLWQQGYTNVEITGWRMLGCAESDTFNTGFKAKTVAGAEVTGSVCKGWFKGSTVRTD